MSCDTKNTYLHVCEYLGIALQLIKIYTIGFQ